MNIVDLFNDFNIPHFTEGYKYCRPGWVNVECPFCTGNPGPHLGFEIASNHFNCWRCGWHPTDFTISKLLNVRTEQAKEIIKQYGGHTYRTKTIPVQIRLKAHKLPSNTMPLQQNHRQYLIGRNFDPDRLQREWKLLGTGPISLLSTELNGKKVKLDYKHRIIIPYIWNNQQVSFDARDITGKVLNKYQACPKDRELIPHKNILYGMQEYWTETGIGVEGPTDVWRLGRRACALSGIEFIAAQVRLIAKTFKRFAVVFDGESETSKESQAFIQATKLISELKFRKVDAFSIKITGDPGEMNQSEADYLVKQLK